MCTKGPWSVKECRESFDIVNTEEYQKLLEVCKEMLKAFDYKYVPLTVIDRARKAIAKAESLND